MMQGTDPASLPLRDIHLPEPVSWWPLAPGWWLLMLLIIMVIALVVFFIRKKKARQTSAIFLARSELHRIRTEYSTNRDKTSLAKELSELLRRVSISIYPRSDTASLTGEAWLGFLDQHNDENLFSKGSGRILIDAPYQSNPEYDSEKLIELVTVWIDSVAKQKRGQAQ